MAALAKFEDKVGLKSGTEICRHSQVSTFPQPSSQKSQLTQKSQNIVFLGLLSPLPRLILRTILLWKESEYEYSSISFLITVTLWPPLFKSFSMNCFLLAWSSFLDVWKAKHCHFVGWKDGSKKDMGVQLSCNFWVLGFFLGVVFNIMSCLRTTQQFELKSSW